MEKNKLGWVSFPEVNDVEGSAIGIGDFGVPSGFDAEKLQLNLSALHRGVIKYGGYEGLYLSADRDGEKDQINIGVSVDSSGNAYGAGSAAIARAKSSESIERFTNSDLNSCNMRNGYLGVFWNQKALDGRITTAEQFDPAVRASQLNGAIKSAAISAVAEHNTVDVIKATPTFFSGLGMSVDFINVGLLSNSIVAEDYTASLKLVSFTSLIKLTMHLMNVPYRNSGHESMYEPFFFSARYSRAVASASVLWLSGLVRPAPFHKSVF